MMKYLKSLHMVSKTSCHVTPTPSSILIWHVTELITIAVISAAVVTGGTFLKR